MEYSIPLIKSKQSKAILNVLNCFLKLTDREIDIISTLIDNDIVIIDKRAKNTIMDSINIDIYGLNNYLVKLRSKGIIINNKILNDVVQACKDKKVTVNILDIQDAN